MKRFLMSTMLLLAALMMFGLSANFSVDPSYAQGSPQQTATLISTPTPTPFVSHHIAPDPVLYSLEQLRAAYDIQPLIDAGFDGTGQTIALVEVSSFSQSDVDSFVQRNNLPTPQIETILLGTAATKLLPSNTEASMDIEIVLTIAPKATVLVYETPTGYDAFARIAADKRAHIVSVSLGGCEGVIPPSSYPVLHRLLVPALSPHLSIFVGSGDLGAFGCAQEIDPTTYQPVQPSIAQAVAVSGLASDPAITAVGGTLLHMTGDHYDSEEVWNTFELRGSSGGGVSAYWPLPAYQKAYYLSDLNPNFRRQIPDVSASADNYLLIGEGGLGTSSGTSLSAPLLAAGTLLIDQYLTTRLKDPAALLIAPEMLYQLKTGYSTGKLSQPPFHEVTKGDNRYYPAGAGFNLATGLGSPDFYNIAQDAQQSYSQLTAIIEPTDAAGFVDRGASYYNQGKLDVALDDFNRALAIDPKSILALTGQGYVYGNQGKLDMALESFAQVIAVDPNYAPAYAELADVFEGQNKFAEALRSYHAYLKMMGDKADPRVVERVHALEAQSTLTATGTAVP